MEMKDINILMRGLNSYAVRGIISLSFETIPSSVIIFTKTDRKKILSNKKVRRKRVKIIMKMMIKVRMII
jgi:hypothetical protein